MSDQALKSAQRRYDNELPKEDPRMGLPEFEVIPFCGNVPGWVIRNGVEAFGPICSKMAAEVFADALNNAQDEHPEKFPGGRWG
jgi:hypothetical protein